MLMMLLLFGSVAIAPGQNGDDELADRLKSLKDADSKIRLRAATDISNLRAKGKLAQPVLLAVLKNEKVAEVRVGLLGALLNTTIYDENQKMILEKLDDKMLRLFAHYVEDEANIVRCAALNGVGLGRSKSKFAVPKVIEAVKTEDSAVKNVAMRCLGDIGPDAATALGVIRMELKTTMQAMQEEDHPYRKMYGKGGVELIQRAARYAIKCIEKK